MKNARIAFILIAGFMVSLLVGCFNPISVMPPNIQEKDNQETGDGQPFAVDVYIGKNARSVTGASSVQIQNGLYNYMQLVVVDVSGQIVSYNEVRKNKSTDQSAVLEIDEIPYGETYKFLLLFGNWERDVIADEPDPEDSGIILGYKDDVYPVLLAAGYREQVVTGQGKVTISMWPLVINTTFEASDSTIVQPQQGEPKDLLQSKDWKVKWNIGRSSGGGGNGLTSLLDSLSASELPVTVRKYTIDGVEKDLSTTVNTSSTLEYSLDGYNKITDIGIPYPVNFYLEFAPFNKTSAEAWSAHAANSPIFDLSVSAPKWIIRNGLNDTLQNGYTDFSKTGKPSAGPDYKSYNGNGGVGFKTKEHLGYTDEDEDGFPDDAKDTDDDGFPDNPGTADPAELILYGGAFMGPTGALDVKIAFSTAGYSGNATVYYRITSPGEYTGANPLPYNMFTGTLGDNFAAGNHTNIPITLPATTAQDIWLVFMKDGRISNRIAIDTDKPANPSNPYEDGYYVKADGSDSNSGDYYHPFYTLNKGVTQAAADHKPVIVIGALTPVNSGYIDAATTFIVTKSVTIKGHPSSGASLTATTGAGRRVLASYAQVILENITLKGGSQPAGAGIYIGSGTLTMKTGAVVTGNGSSATAWGGGVFVAKGATFELAGGTISGNWTGTNTNSGGGGGVYIEGTTHFRSGFISSNTSYNDGGGVAVGDKGILYMYTGAEVGSNKAYDDGGGIKVDYKGAFVMYGGRIVKNQCAHYGGGLRLEQGTVDVRAGVLIAGSGHTEANYAGSGGHAYCRYGPKPYNPTITFAFTDYK